MSKSAEERDNSITKENAEQRTDIYDFVNTVLNADIYLSRAFGSSLSDSTHLLAIVGSIKASLDSFNASRNLNLEECLKLLNLENRFNQYRFNEDRSQIVEISCRRYYRKFSSSFEYDENQRISRINISYFSGEEVVYIIPEYDENDLCINLNFEIDYTNGSNEYNPNVIAIPTFSFNAVTNYIFPQRDKEALDAAIDSLSNEKISSIDEPTLIESGIVYRNWDELREALIIFGEGNAKRQGEKNILELEEQAFIEGGLESPFKETRAGTADVSDWVDRIFKQSPEGKRSFDYEDFEGAAYNNFHKCQVSIDYMPDGSYILRIFQGQASDRPEIQLANATLQERVINCITQEFSFPQNGEYFYVCGILDIEDQIIRAGYDVNNSFFHTLMNEQLTLSKLLEEEPYNSKTGSAINFQTDKFEIKLDLGLPRSSRIRGQIGVNGSGNTGIIPYDSWEVKPVIGYIAGRVGHNSSGEPNLPKLRVSITPKVLKARGSDDYNEMLELLERIRNIIVSVQLRKL